MKLLRNPIVVGILAVVALLLIFRNFVGPLWTKTKQLVSRPVPAVSSAAAPARPPAAETVPPREAPAAAKRLAAEPVVPGPIDASAIAARADRWITAPLRDPFQARVLRTNQVPAASVLSLSAIWRQTGRRLAVVNKRVVAEGDIIMGFTVRSIEADRIWVDGDAGREPLYFKLFLPQETLASESSAVAVPEPPEKASPE